MSEEYFNKALSNFINDFAGGDAIRHLSDNGFTVKEICGRLDYPMSSSKVGEIVWKHYLNEGIICLEEPKEGAVAEKVEYVKEQDSFGKTSFRRVVKSVKNTGSKYICVDFGKRIYKDKEGFEKALDILGTGDKDYILGLPWPVQPVWHVLDERMERITKALGGYENG